MERVVGAAFGLGVGIAAGPLAVFVGMLAAAGLWAFLGVAVPPHVGAFHWVSFVLNPVLCLAAAVGLGYRQGAVDGRHARDGWRSPVLVFLAALALGLLLAPRVPWWMDWVGAVPLLK